MFVTDSPIMWQIHTEVGSINNMKKNEKRTNAKLIDFGLGSKSKTSQAISKR